MLELVSLVSRSSVFFTDDPDIWAAFCATTRTMMSTESWFDNPTAVLGRINIDEDLHSQIAIWLTARVINAISDGLLTTTDEFYVLCADMARWEDMGGPTTHPVVRRKTDGELDNPFPRILFSTHSSSECYPVRYEDRKAKLTMTSNWPHHVEQCYGPSLGVSSIEQPD